VPGSRARERGNVLYMVIETYTQGPGPVYTRASERGRMLPPGLAYLESEEPGVFEQRIANWSDLVEFEIVPVVSSRDAAARGRVISCRRLLGRRCAVEMR
jgi:hypothetical protein